MDTRKPENMLVTAKKGKLVIHSPRGSNLVVLPNERFALVIALLKTYLP